MFFSFFPTFVQTVILLCGLYIGLFCTKVIKLNIFLFPKVCLSGVKLNIAFFRF